MLNNVIRRTVCGVGEQAAGGGKCGISANFEAEAEIWIQGVRGKERCGMSAAGSVNIIAQLPLTFDYQHFVLCCDQGECSLVTPYSRGRGNGMRVG